MESGKERTGTYYENTSGHLFDTVRNADAVQWLELECPENQEVKRSLETVICVLLHALS